MDIKDRLTIDVTEAMASIDNVEALLNSVEVRLDRVVERAREVESILRSLSPRVGIEP